MKAIVFAAGEGTRLRPLTADRPKPMIPVGDRPILAYILTWLREQGVGAVGINLHYRPEAIQAFVSRGAFGLDVQYSFEERLLGSAGALPAFEQFLDGEREFVAVYGDTLAVLPLPPIVSLHRAAGAVLTMAVMDHPNPTEAGIVDLAETRDWHAGTAGRVRRLVEKPAPDEVFSTVANAGVFVMDPRIAAYIPRGWPTDIARDLIPALLAAGEHVAGWKIPRAAVVWDVGTWPSYRRALEEWPAIWASREERFPSPAVEGPAEHGTMLAGFGSP